MEGTPHTMMVGEGAEKLALEDPSLQLVALFIIMFIDMFIMYIMFIIIYILRIRPCNWCEYRQVPRLTSCGSVAGNLSSMHTAHIDEYDIALRILPATGDHVPHQF